MVVLCYRVATRLVWQPSSNGGLVLSGCDASAGRSTWGSVVWSSLLFWAGPSKDIGMLVQYSGRPEKGKILWWDVAYLSLAIGVFNFVCRSHRFFKNINPSFFSRWVCACHDYPWLVLAFGYAVCESGARTWQYESHTHGAAASLPRPGRRFDPGLFSTPVVVERLSRHDGENN